MWVDKFGDTRNLKYITFIICLSGPLSFLVKHMFIDLSDWSAVGGQRQHNTTGPVISVIEELQALGEKNI